MGPVLHFYSSLRKSLSSDTHLDLSIMSKEAPLWISSCLISEIDEHEAQCQVMADMGLLQRSTNSPRQVVGSLWRPRPFGMWGKRRSYIESSSMQVTSERSCERAKVELWICDWLLLEEAFLVEVDSTDLHLRYHLRPQSR